MLLIISQQTEVELKIAIASDHAALALKDAISERLRELGHEPNDLGPYDTSSVDYPDFARLVCDNVTSGEASLGILLCGSGIGMSMAANKYPGIRAALCFNRYMGSMTRLHNDANVLCLGERVIGQGTALEIVEGFVSTEFEGGRHQRRVDKMMAFEELK